MPCGRLWSLGSRELAGVVLPGGGFQELACDGGVADGGGVVEAEHGGEVQGVGTVGEGFVELAAGAEALEGGGEAAAGLGHPVLADGPGGHGGLLAEDEVRPGGAWPPVAAVLEPGEEQVPGQVIQRAGLAADDQPPAAGIDVGQVELADGLGPGRVDGGQGEREAGGGGDGGGPSLVYLAGLKWLEEAQGPLAVVDAAGGVAEDRAGFLAVPEQGTQGG